VSLSFAFSPLPSTTGGPTGFSRGHITVTGDGGTVSSAGRAPDQSMMLAVALADLLATISTMLTGPADGRYRFVGADSSFQLVLIRAGDRMSVTGDGLTVATVGVAEFGEVARRDIGGYARALMSRLPAGDPVYRDLADAREDLLDALPD
jgi:hypothetical protein